MRAQSIANLYVCLFHVLLCLVHSDELEISSSTEDEVLAPFSSISDTSAEDEVLDTAPSGLPSDFGADDSLVQVSARRALSTSQTNGTDSSAMAYIRGRLASEESFSSRLRQLLVQSSKDSNAKQQNLQSLQAQLRDANLNQKKLTALSVKQIDEEERKVAEEHDRADVAEAKLRNATAGMDVLKRNVNLLKGRTRTLLSHLANVTHLGKAMEAQLAASRWQTNAVGQQLETEHFNQLAFSGKQGEMRNQLRRVQASEATEELRAKAAERKNGFLQKRYEALTKRDQILQVENDLLRRKLDAQSSQEKGLREELDRMKSILEESQKSNAQLQTQYATTLAGQVSTKGIGVMSEASGPSASSNVAPTHDSAILDLKRDITGLTTLVKEERKEAAKPKSKLRGSQIRERLLGSQSQGLDALIQHLPHTMKQKKK